jgi:Ca-activated chloride channel family protein
MHSARASNLRVEWPDVLDLVWEQQPQGYAFENDVFNVAAFVKTPAKRTAFKTAKLWGQLENQPEEVLMGEAALSYTESITNTLARLTAHAQYSELLGEKAQHHGASQTENRQLLAVKYRLITDETNFVLVHERAGGDKAEEMPVAHKVAQMHPAGHGGVGTISFSHAALPASPKPILFSIQDDSPFASQSLATPSVWRTNRTAAADRVNALASAGQDDYEIPAFLRKQAEGPGSDMPPVKPKTRQSIDKRNPMYWIQGEHATRSRKLLASASGYVGITPAGLDHWLAINDPSFWPKTYAGLRDLGLGQAVSEWLEFEIGLDLKEASVVEAFLCIVRELGLANTVGLKGAVNALKHAVVPRQQEKTEGDIAFEIRLALKDSKASAWPKNLVEFPENA